MPLSTSLIEAWELDEASGTRAGSHGSNTLTDNNTVTSATGLINALAADFERDNGEYLSIADNADVSMGDIDYTFEVWFKCESLGTRMQIVAKDTDTSREYAISINDGDSSDRVRFYGNSNTGVNVMASTFGALSTGTWYQIIARHDATANTLEIQINNTGFDSAAMSGGTPDGAAEFRIGARAYPFFNDPFDGLIGPVRLWKRKLSDAECTELWNSGSGRDYAYIAGGAVITKSFSDTLTIGLSETFGIETPFVAKNYSDTLTIGLSDSFTLEQPFSAKTFNDALGITLNETFTSFLRSSFVDTLAIGVDASHGVSFGGNIPKSFSDTLTIAISESFAKGVKAFKAYTDTLTIGVVENHSVAFGGLVTKSFTDTLVIGVSESFIQAQRVYVVFTDTLTISVIDTFSVADLEIDYATVNAILGEGFPSIQDAW